jgi:ABC-type oligopeptide transport system substrate-binding subunit
MNSSINRFGMRVGLAVHLLVFLFSQAQGNPDGMLVTRISRFPVHFNYFINPRAETRLLSDLALERLADNDADMLAFKPRLAKSWIVSPDFRKIAFELNPLARWSDGKPVTGKDVRFTFQFIVDKKRNPSAEIFRQYLGPIQSIRLSGKGQNITFVLSRSHFDNLRRLAEQTILPQHRYKGWTARNFIDKRRVLMGSGPYLVEDVSGVTTIILHRNKKWWGENETSLAHLKNFYNFEIVALRAIESEPQAFQIYTGDEAVDPFFLRWRAQSGDSRSLQYY